MGNTDGRCVCSSGFSGADCASTLTVIHSGTPRNGTVQQNHWHYYKYSAPTTLSSITAELYEFNTQGYVQLYILQGSAPSLLEYAYHDSSPERALHNIYFQIDGSGDHYWYIGVYGSTFIPIQSEASYELLGMIYLMIHDQQH